MILKRGRKWALYSHEGKLIALHPTKESAKAQEYAINIAKARRSGHRIPRKRRK